MKALCCCCSILMALGSVRARNWVDVIDTTTYASALVDDHKESMRVWGAVDSYLAADRDASPPLEDSDTPSPVANIVEVPIPTFEPTQMPTDGPTATPSAFPTEALITCEDEMSSPYVIRMHDNWGDGWNGAKLKISSLVSSVYSELPGHRSIFEGTLNDGFDSYSYVCLNPQVCYDIDVDGEGQWLEEVKWDIRALDEENDDGENEVRTLAKGGAPSNCKFSVPSRESGRFACPFQCITRSPAPTPSPTLTPSKVLPTPAPTFIRPTRAPSNLDEEDRIPTRNSNETAPENATNPVTVDPSNMLLPPRDAEIISKIPYSPPEDSTPSSGPAVGDPTATLVDPLKSGDLDGMRSVLPSDLPSMAPSLPQPTLVPTDGHVKLGNLSSLFSSSNSPTVAAAAEIELAAGSARDIVGPPPRPIAAQEPTPQPTSSHNAYHSFFFKFQQLADQADEEQLPSDFPSLSPTAARY